MGSMLDINIKGVMYNAEEKVTAYDMVKEDVAAKIRQARPPPPEPVVAFQAATQAPVAQREVNFLQHLLAQNQPEEDVIDVPMEDAVLEATRELNIYRAYPQDGTLSTDANEFWRTKHHIPHIRAVARKYPAFPVGKTDVERAFSKTGVIYCPRRKRLLGFNCKMMLVINSALRGFDYMLDGDVRLQIPDFIVHERDLIDATQIVDGDVESDEDL